MLRTCAVSLVLISAVASSAIAPVSAQTPTAGPTSTKAPVPVAYVKPAPPGRLVDIGGRRLHLECKGDRVGPTVIFEAGLSQYTAHSTYGKAQALIAPFARVCTYDRAGLGWSDPVAGVRTHQAMVEDLHKLVADAKLNGPFILVGHSVGGLLTRLYAKQYPDDVAGMVLVDATPEAYLFAPGMAQARNAIIAKIDAGLKDAQDSVPVVAMPAGTSADIVIAFLPQVLHAVRQEYAAIDLAPTGLRRPGGYGTLGDTPLAVIRRGKTANPPGDDDQRWRELQEAMAELSTRSFLVMAENSGHVVPYDEPQVVADAVRRILEDIDRR